MRLRPDSSGAYPKCCRTELCLDIISRIAHRGSVSKQSLIREMNVSERTIERNMKLILKFCRGIHIVKRGRLVEYHCTGNPFTID